jgi:hypothetical protein
MLTLLHIGIERGMIKSKLVFEPWTLDPAGESREYWHGAA